MIKQETTGLISKGEQVTSSKVTIMYLGISVFLCRLLNWLSIEVNECNVTYLFSVFTIAPEGRL